MPPCLPRLSFYLTITALLGVGVGCTRSLYRKRADRESYSAIAAKSSMLPPELQLRDPVIEPDPESRFFNEFNPDHPPMPPDDPLSHHFMVRVAGKSGPSVWRANNPDDPDRDAAWRERLPKDASGAVELNLKSAMRLALVNSRDFQTKKEELYVSALDVTLERFRLSPQFALGSTGSGLATNNLVGQRPNLPADQLSPPRGALARVDPDGNEGAGVLTDGSVRWVTSTGANLLASFANSFVWSFKGSESTESASSLVNFGIVQPLMRLGGKERILASLTQSERDLLANVRQMHQFQNGFYVFTAAGRESGDGPSSTNVIGAKGLGNIARAPAGRPGVPRAMGFLYILEEEQQIRNSESNVARLRESLDQLAAAFDAGRLSSRLQVDQARQALLNSQSSLLSKRAAYETYLDRYKVDLGLPPDLPVVIKDPLLEKYRTTDPAATALDRKLVLLLAKIQNRDLAATQEELKEYAEEARELMAQMGIRKFSDLTGRSDLLDMRAGIDHWKASGLDFSKIFYQPKVAENVARNHCETQDHGLERALDNKLIAQAQAALEGGEKVVIETPISNVNRTVGAMLSNQVASRFGHAGLPADSITVKLTGTAGQSFAAFLAHGITFELTGEGNDYVGKGLCGGRIVIKPPLAFNANPSENIIVGNTVMYGATAGESYFRGVAGERFCVRNSGASAVVEGVGDHGCEYMTGGTVVVLGQTGRNFAAGMSGGVAYVLDADGLFAQRCNLSMVALEKVEPAESVGNSAVQHKGQADEITLKALIEKHAAFTGSVGAQTMLDNWNEYRGKFVKVMPNEYKRALIEMAEQKVLEAA